MEDQIPSTAEKARPLHVVFSSHPAEWVMLNMVDTLQSMNIDLSVYDWGAGYRFYDADWNQVQRKKMNEGLLEHVKKEHKRSPVNLLITYFWRRHTDGKVIDAIRDMGIVCVNFGCNNLHQFHLQKPLIGHYDHHWVTEAAAVEKFASEGASAVRVQQGANPKYYFPVGLQKDCDMTFTGSCYGERIDTFNKVVRAGIDFHVFGFRWGSRRSFHGIVGEQLVPKRILYKYEGAGLGIGLEELKIQMLETEHLIRRLGGLGLGRFPGMIQSNSPHLHEGLSFKDMVQLFSRSKISMNFSACGNPSDMRHGRLTQIKLRDFEGPMSGALLLTEYQEELNEFFDIGKEIVCYHDVDDLIEKAKFYIRESEEADRIRAAARARSLSDHTWEKRFEELFSKLGLTYSRKGGR